MASAPANARLQKHRDALREAGLRPMQIWGPDARRPGFAQECGRQCRVVARSDQVDTTMRKFMDESLADVEGWTD